MMRQNSELTLAHHNDDLTMKRWQQQKNQNQKECRALYENKKSEQRVIKIGNCVGT